MAEKSADRERTNCNAATAEMAEECSTAWEEVGPVTPTHGLTLDSNSKEPLRLPSNRDPVDRVDMESTSVKTVTVCQVTRSATECTIAVCTPEPIRAMTGPTSWLVHEGMGRCRT